MTLLNRRSSFADATAHAVSDVPRRYAVHLVRRETGRLHVVAGIPLTVFTCDPEQARADLMRNRDPMKWQALIEERLDTEDLA